jgi:hypothetical protein
MNELTGQVVPMASHQQMAVPIKSYPQRLIDVLDRALHDPSIPMDRIERTIALVKDAMKDEAERAFAEDYSRLQAALPTFQEKGQIIIRPGAKPQTYAQWSDMNRILRPALAEYGFGLTHMSVTEEKTVTVTTTLLHKGGSTRQTMLTLPLDQSGSKNIVQAFGSSLSYAKRYNAVNLLNLSSSAEENDDDGMAAGGMATLTDEHVGEIQSLIADSGADIKAFLAHMGLPEGATVRDLRETDYSKAKSALEHKRKVEAEKRNAATQP